MTSDLQRLRDPCPLEVRPTIPIPGPDPLLEGLVIAIREHVGKRCPVAVEIREDELLGLLGSLGPVADLLPRIGGVLVYRGIEIRTRETGLGRGRFMPVFDCRACAGAGALASTRCHRCSGTGERRGAP